MKHRRKASLCLAPSAFIFFEKCLIGTLMLAIQIKYPNLREGVVVAQSPRFAERGELDMVKMQVLQPTRNRKYSCYKVKGQEREKEEGVWSSQSKKTKILSRVHMATLHLSVCVPVCANVS